MGSRERKRYSEIEREVERERDHWTRINYIARVVVMCVACVVSRVLVGRVRGK